MILYNKALNDIVHVSRAYNNMPRLDERAEVAAPRAGGGDRQHGAPRPRRRSSSAPAACSRPRPSAAAGSPATCREQIEDLGLVLGAAIDPDTRRVIARCEVDNSENLLRAGMFAVFTITTGEPLHAPAVPPNALVREMDGSISAWTTNDRKHFTRRRVTPGLRQNNLVEIKAGLMTGEQLVSDGAIFLSNLVSISAVE